MPAARELAPMPARPRSRTTTRPAPSRAAKCAAQPPTVPAPTTTRSARCRVMRAILTDRATRRQARRAWNTAAPAMLTDYQVHLRPDEPGTDAERHFTAENAERYRAVAQERGIAELGVSEHVYRFSQALDVWRHPLWLGTAVDDLDAYCAFVREETDLRLGIEADYVPGAEDRLAELLAARDW